VAVVVHVRRAERVEQLVREDPELLARADELVELQVVEERSRAVDHDHLREQRHVRPEQVRPRVRPAAEDEDEVVDHAVVVAVHVEAGRDLPGDRLQRGREQLVLAHHRVEPVLVSVRVRVGVAGLVVRARVLGLVRGDRVADRRRVEGRSHGETAVRRLREVAVQRRPRRVRIVEQRAVVGERRREGGLVREPDEHHEVVERPDPGRAAHAGRSGGGSGPRERALPRRAEDLVGRGREARGEPRVARVGRPDHEPGRHQPAPRQVRIDDQRRDRVAHHREARGVVRHAPELVPAREQVQDLPPRLDHADRHVAERGRDGRGSEQERHQRERDQHGLRVPACRHRPPHAAPGGRRSRLPRGPALRTRPGPRDPGSARPHTLTAPSRSR